MVKPPSNGDIIIIITAADSINGEIINIISKTTLTIRQIKIIQIV
jgi:hypothetical protein